jgi:hypothetical protein
MTIEPRQLAQIVQEGFGNLPHPDVPELTNAEYPNYERLAGMKRNPHKPTSNDVKDIYSEIKSSGITPSQWEHAWMISRPLANRLLGKDPTIQELVRHADAHPSEIYDYYYHMPSPSHPEIKAGVMAEYIHMANDPSNRHLERKPLLREVAQFAASKYHPEQIDAHYQQMKQDRENV